MTILAQTSGVPPAAGAEDRLVARAQAGDQGAFSELAGPHVPRLRRVLFRITKDCEAAKDAVQEALLRAWKNFARFEGRSRFSTWLTRIGINEAYRGVGRSKETVSLDDSIGAGEVDIADTSGQPEDLLESREFLAAVERALNELPLDYQTAVRLRDVEGLSTREAAELLGIGERAVKSRLHRGRIALRESLGEYFD